MTSDHLGSPRVITNENGQVTNRKDYMAFGEETQTTQRTTQLKYENQTETRKGYTGYEKDEESGLDFAQARYYNSSHGRYTSVDPLTASANVKNPQTFNRYSYVLNSPYEYVDPLGLIASTTGACGQCGDYNYVDGSAFSGSDSTLNNLFEDMALSREVEAALTRLSETPEYIFGGGVSDTETSQIAVSLADILKNGNNESKRIVSAIVNSDITIDVANITTSQAEIVDVAGANKAIASGKLTENQALGFLKITIARQEFTNVVSVAAAVQANLIHEAVHAISKARVLTTLATGAPKKYEDRTRQSDEIQASATAARYLRDRGGDFVKFGQHQNVKHLTSKGGLDWATLKSKGANAASGTLQDYLKAKGVIWKK